jgi:hypothetical protein
MPDSTEKKSPFFDRTKISSIKMQPGAVSFGDAYVQQTTYFRPVVTFLNDRNTARDVGTFCLDSR